MLHEALRGQIASVRARAGQRLAQTTPNLPGLVKRNHVAAVDNHRALVHAVQGVHWLLPARLAPSTTTPPTTGAFSAMLCDSTRAFVHQRSMFSGNNTSLFFLHKRCTAAPAVFALALILVGCHCS